MKTAQFARNLLIGSMAMLASASVAHASDDTHQLTVPAQALQGGYHFIVETVIHNVRTGERTVVSEDCEAGANATGAPGLNCIQDNPDPQGMQIFVKTIRP